MEILEANLVEAPPSSLEKRLRSQPPDIIVVVGSGDNTQEFKCYSQILCYMCDHFDTILSHPLKEKETGRIELPDKDPEEWKVFYEFIAPSTAPCVELTEENIGWLTSWFHEYQMTNMLKKCDKFACQIFLDMYKGKFLWKGNRHNKKAYLAAADELFIFLSFCEKYSLESSTKLGLEELNCFLCHGYDLLLESNELTKKVIDVYDCHKNLNIIGDGFNKFQDNILQEVEVDWNNELFPLLINARLKLSLTQHSV